MYSVKKEMGFITSQMFVVKKTKTTTKYSQSKCKSESISKSWLPIYLELRISKLLTLDDRATTDTSARTDDE